MQSENVLYYTFFCYLTTIAVLAANNKPFLAILGTISHQDLVWDYPKIGNFKIKKIGLLIRASRIFNVC